MTPKMPIGTFTKKIQRQLRYSTRKPPSTGPMAGASTVTLARMADARGRSIGRVGAVEHRRADGREHAAADTLDEAEHDERRSRLHASPHSAEARREDASGRG